MKVLIESTPTLNGNNQPLEVLNNIVKAAIQSKTLDEFREKVKTVDTTGYQIGFGSNHSWVQQNVQDARMLLITEQ